jgi:hypothetical protein
MPVNTLVDNEFATLWCDPDKKIIHHKIKKWAFGTNLRNILDKGCDALKANSCTKWLSDDRLNGVLKPDDEEWARNNWFPRTLKAGWKHWAVVLPEKVVGQMNMKRFTEDYSKAGINAMLFSDSDSAMKWLEKQ